MRKWLRTQRLRGGAPRVHGLAQILSVVYGQQLPSPDASIGYQVFGVAVATTGLATFALVLALLQQVVLEVIDENVKQGRRVYEEQHVRNTTEYAKHPPPPPPRDYVS